MRVVKIVFSVLLLVVLLAVVFVGAPPLWMGQAVERFAPSVVSDMTDTGFSIGKFDVNLYSGDLHIADVALQNPKRFFEEAKNDGKKSSLVTLAADIVSKTASAAHDSIVPGARTPVTNAVSFSSLDVRFSASSALSDTVRINEIVISDLNLYGDLTYSNIREISDSVSGEEKEASKKEPEQSSAESGGKKVVIDRVFLKNTVIKWGPVTVSLPDVEVLDIGKGEGGASEGDAVSKVLDALCASADKVNIGCGQALRVAVYGGEKISLGVEAVSELAKPGELVDTVKEGGKLLKKIFK